MASSAASVYDFTSRQNATKWRGILKPALRKIQKQVNPRMGIDDDAISYMEELVYHLLAQICSSQPHSTSDVVAYITKNFVFPINTWAINVAQRTMERHQIQGKSKSVFNFPVEKLHPLLEKEVFNYAVEVDVVRYIAAILDYIAADILKLSGNFKKNTGGAAIRIKTSDIQLSLSFDVPLHSLFQRLSTQHLGEGGLPPIEASEESEQVSSYDQLVRQLMSNEEKYISQLNLILKIFQEPFIKRPDLFPPKEVKKVFVNLPELYELSVKLLASLDECMEMAGKVAGVAECPQAGFVFEEIAESEEFDVYVNYARTYEEAVTVLQTFIETDEAVEYLKTLTEPDLFKEAIQYVLPKSLMEPFYHFLYYFDVMNMLMKKSPSEEDQDAYEAAQGCMVGIKAELEKKCSGFLPTRKEEIEMQKPGDMASMKIIDNVQKKIEGWEGSDLGQCCTEFIMEGSLKMMREGNRKKMERHVFLLDGLVVCCKHHQGGHLMYRFKEKINLRQVKLIDQQNDLNSTVTCSCLPCDMKYSFQLIEPQQLAYTFYFSKIHEKFEWMSALTHLLTKSIFDRKLNMKLKEEEQADAS